jgi:hypothetical protein
MLSLLGDVVVALLLIATIGYSVVLNRRLTTVRSDRDKFETLVKNLNTASQRAEAAIGNLRTTAEDLGRRLEKRVEEARGLSDDLVYMIERGSGIADKLVTQIRASRDEMKPDFKPEAKPGLRSAERAAEHIVEAVMRDAEPVAAPPAPPATLPRPAFLRGAAQIHRDDIRVERIEPRVSVPTLVDVTAPAEEQPERANAPSRAERDLLRALSARRR